MATKHIIIAGAALLLLSACTAGPDFAPPRWHLPQSWNFVAKEKSIGSPSTVKPAEGWQSANWWTVFNDPLLDQMEADVAAQNLDVQTAITRLDEARAQAGTAAASLYPQVKGTAAAIRAKPGEISSDSFGGVGETGAGAAIPNIPAFNILQYGFDASWEIDLWGDVRRSVESADAQVLAADEMRRDALLSAQAELAADYIKLRGAQNSIRIAQGDIDAARTQASLASAQARTGLTSDEDTTTAEAQVSIQSARIPQLQQQEALQVNAIEMLLGRMPGDLRDALAARAPPPLPSSVPVGEPSDLINRRPDIRAAEARLHSAVAEIGVADAAFYPQITLLGAGVIQGSKLRDLSDWASKSWLIGPSVSLPIFEGGKLVETLHLRKAQQREAAIAYRQTVLQAMHEVDNALTAVLAEERRQSQLGKAAQQQRLALKLARSRYQNGLTNFVDVTVAEENLFDVEQQAIDSRTTLGTDLIQLYKALGV